MRSWGCGSSRIVANVCSPRSTTHKTNEQFETRGPFPGTIAGCAKGMAKRARCWGPLLGLSLMGQLSWSPSRLLNAMYGMMGASHDFSRSHFSIGYPLKIGFRQRLKDLNRTDSSFGHRFRSRLICKRLSKWRLQFITPGSRFYYFLEISYIQARSV